MATSPVSSISGGSRGWGGRGPNPAGCCATGSRDPTGPGGKGSKGCGFSPPNPAYRIVAEFVPYDPPREVAVPTILGTTEKMKAPGYVKFKLAGRELTLEPVVEDP